MILRRPQRAQKRRQQLKRSAGATWGQPVKIDHLFLFQKYNFMSKKLYTAIVFFIPGSNPVPVMKYRKISNTENFVNFVAVKYANKVSIINFYDSDTRDFVKQVRI